MHTLIDKVEENALSEFPRFPPQSNGTVRKAKEVLGTENNKYSNRNNRSSSRVPFGRDFPLAKGNSRGKYNRVYKEVQSPNFIPFPS
jgi:hypothetical protein